MQLELLNFALSSLHVDFVESQQAKSPRGEQLGMNFEIHLGQHATIKRQFRVELQASISEQTPRIGPVGFQVKASIVGIVKVQDDVSDDMALSIAQVGGVNVLYGTLRGVIATATGVFPTGPMILRSLTPKDIIGVKPEKVGVATTTQAKQDANQQASKLVQAVTDTKKLRGESLLASAALRRKLRRAKRRVKAAKP